MIYNNVEIAQKLAERRDDEFFDGSAENHPDYTEDFSGATEGDR